MANIFTKTNDYVESPNRNVFDGSFANNLTLKMGDLVPVFCKEVLPGDAFKIDATFGLRFMPMVFPVQTRLKANLHFFYVRNRTLWKDWSDFIGKTKEVTAPYLQLNATQKQNILSTGSLGDYLGLPTRSYGDYASHITKSLVWQKPTNKALFTYKSLDSLSTTFTTPFYDIPVDSQDLDSSTGNLGLGQYSNNIDFTGCDLSQIKFDIHAQVSGFSEGVHWGIDLFDSLGSRVAVGAISSDSYDASDHLIHVDFSDIEFYDSNSQLLDISSSDLSSQIHYIGYSASVVNTLEYDIRIDWHGVDTDLVFDGSEIIDSVDASELSGDFRTIKD